MLSPKVRGERFLDTISLWVNAALWLLQKLRYQLSRKKSAPFITYIYKERPHRHWTQFPISLQERWYWHPQMKCWVDIEGFVWYAQDTPSQHPVHWLSSLAPGQIGLDVGAHRGYWTLLYGRRVGPEGRIFCLEPNPKNYRYLLRNLAKNDLFFVTPLPLAAWHETTQLSLAFPASQPYQSFTGRVQPTPGRILAVTIDQLVQAIGLPRLDWIKLDIEGAEVEALQGAKRTLQTYQPTLWLEYHHNKAPILSLLKESGYEVRQAIDLEEGIGYLWAEPHKANPSAPSFERHLL